MRQWFQTMIACLVATITLGMFFWISRQPTTLVLLITVSLVLCVIIGAAGIVRRYASPYPLVHLPMIFLMLAAALIVFLIMEQQVGRRVIAFVVSFLVGFFFWRNPDMAVPVDKPLRRMKMMTMVGGAYGCIAGMYAALLFFETLQSWILIVATSAVLSAIAVAIWRLYYDAPVKRFALWGIIMCVMTAELLWVLSLLPFHYFISALFAAWLWYVLQLLGRFHFHPDGVVWKRQGWFLGTNAVLFILCMYLARWV